MWAEMSKEYSAAGIAEGEKWAAIGNKEAEYWKKVGEDYTKFYSDKYGIPQKKVNL
jgi:hypothetical protein